MRHQALGRRSRPAAARPGSPAAGSGDLRAGTDRIFLTRTHWLAQLSAAGSPACWTCRTPTIR
ncbi:hypothetical protein ACNAW0_00805 [Micromonospora sp. SL1-18]|uniref:hypothetical protein n=1 Tax=Micromonospora sp. SL1-18 TaxID=3399128 RepID=UPI003A4E2D24